MTRELPASRTLPAGSPSEFIIVDNDGEPQPGLPPYLVGSFFFLGVGVLLPWNALMSSIDLFSLAFPDVPFGLVVTLAYMLSTSATSLFCAVVPRPQSRYVPDILLGYLAFAAVAAALPFLAPAKPLPGWTSTNLLAVIASVVITGVCSAFIQSSLYAVAALFPSGECTQALSSGGGLAGVVAALLRMCYLATSVGGKAGAAARDGGVQDGLDSVKSSVNPFFYACGLICALCAVEMLWISRSAEWRGAIYDATLASQYDARVPVRRAATPVDSVGTFEKTLQPFLAVLITMTITLGLFPGVLTDMRSARRSPSQPGHPASADLSQSWFIVLTVFLFATGDWLGKATSLASFGTLLKSPDGVLSSALIRLLFIPVAILAGRGVIPSSDALTFALVFCLGYSGGLLVTSSLVLGPEMVQRASEKDTAGKNMFLGLIAGLALGAAVSPILKVLSTP